MFRLNQPLERGTTEKNRTKHPRATPVFLVSPSEKRFNIHALLISMKSSFFTLKIIALLTFVLLLAPAASTQTGGHLRFDRKLSRKEEGWVHKTLRSLTLEEKIGQMI